MQQMTALTDEQMQGLTDAAYEQIKQETIRDRRQDLAERRIAKAIASGIRRLGRPRYRRDTITPDGVQHRRGEVDERAPSGLEAFDCLTDDAHVWVDPNAHLSDRKAKAKRKPRKQISLAGIHARVEVA